MMTPDEADFTVNDPHHVFEEQLTSDGIEVPDGDSGVLAKQAVDPDMLRITSDGCCLTIRFNAIEIPDELCVVGYRDQVFHALEQHPECTLLRFDLTGIRLVPSGLLGLLASVQQRGHVVEILNPSPDLLATLRATKLNRLLKIQSPGP